MQAKLWIPSNANNSFVSCGTAHGVTWLMPLFYMWVPVLIEARISALRRYAHSPFQRGSSCFLAPNMVAECFLRLVLMIWCRCCSACDLGELACGANRTVKKTRWNYRITRHTSHWIRCSRLPLFNNVPSQRTVPSHIFLQMRSVLIILSVLRFSMFSCCWNNVLMFFLEDGEGASKYESLNLGQPGARVLKVESRFRLVGFTSVRFYEYLWFAAFWAKVL